jgi:ketosteroid isomerase-like protein
MSRENVEIVRRVIESFNRGDWEVMFKEAAPGFIWDNSRAMNPDMQGIYTAEEAILVFKRGRQVFESFWFEINEMIPIGDHVVVPHTSHAHGRDGIETHARSTWLFTVHDGKIQRGCLYQDKQEALEAAGVSG